jgi:hypothetical protein
VEPTGRVSRVYGWRYDRLSINPDGSIGGYVDDAEIHGANVHELDCNPAQFDVLCDDDSFHIIVYGSRRSSKTELGARWQVKQIARWPGKLLAAMREKRAKSRAYVEEKLLPLVPARWLRQGKEGIRKAQDELAILCENGTRLRFLTAKVPDDARGDGIPAGFIDETQLVDAETRSNLLLSCSEGGSAFQTLETGTLLDGEFMEYLEAAKSNERYRVVELSVTDNVHLDVAYDEITGAEIPEFVISARSIMDPKRFAQEVGVWDAAAKRFRPQVSTPTGAVYWPFKRTEHVKAYDSRFAGKEIRRMFSSAHPGVGTDITAQVAASKFRTATPHLVGVDVEAPPLAAVIARVFRAPPGVPDIVWVIDEIGIEDEPDGIRLGQHLQRAGYSNSGIVPDAGGKHSDGGKSTIRALRNEDHHVQGPRRNPSDRDRRNVVNAKLRNAKDEATLFIDPRCKRLIAALQGQRLTQRGDREAEMECKSHHFARALGYVVHYFWPSTAERRAA